MIIDSDLKTFNDSLEGKTFSIEDNSFIFDILRNKMYSDPISSIVREVSCNARDSHRAIGSNRPIEITLPISTNPFLKIKDYGTGLSPDLIENVFIKYAASTKRGDSIQTGGFGLGAKTPFSYSDSFSIVTVSNKIKYNYVCYIDETKRGKISLLSESETSEDNSTEIAIKIKPEDYSRFSSAVVALNEFWIEPIIVKNIDSYYLKKKKYSYVFDKFSLGYDEREANIYAIIDGIKYPVNNPNIVKNNLLRSLKHSLFLFFNNSECSLSATREQLSYDQKTVDLINSRITESMNQIVSMIKEEIDKKETYKEALSFYRNFCIGIFNSHDTIESMNLSYKGKKLYISSSIYIPGSTILTFNLKSSYRRSDRLESKISYSLMTSGEVDLYYNDFTDLGTDAFQTRHFKTYFQSQENRGKKIYIIFPTVAASLDLIKRQIDFECFDIKPLSKIIEKPKLRVIKDQDKESTRLTLYKYGGSFYRVAQKESKEVSNKILVKLNKSKNLFAFDNDYHNLYKLDHLVKLGYSIYGLVEEIFDEYSEDMANFKSIDDVIEIISDEVGENYLNYNVVENVVAKVNLDKLMLISKYKELKSSLIYEDEHISTIENIFTLTNKIEVSDDMRKKIILLSVFCENLLAEEIKVKEEELMNKIESFDITEINKKLLARLPLIGLTSRYSFNMKEVSDYMNGIYLLNQQNGED